MKIKQDPRDALGSRDAGVDATAVYGNESHGTPHQRWGEPDERTEDTVASLTDSGGSVGLSGESVLDDVRSWLARFVRPLHAEDLDTLTLWAAHTHVVKETYSTPRLLLDSPMPGSGKTTVLDHLSRLANMPVLMGSLTSPAMISRLLDGGMRTLLIDEADRNLDPKRDGVGDLLAVLNSGYRRGASRPTTVPGPNGSWIIRELPTFAPVALAGNHPNLPDDVMSRTIRVLLVPDVDGEVEPSDWEDIEDQALQLGERLASWADAVRGSISTSRPDVPHGLGGRDRERWFPLLRVAYASGPAWTTRALHLIDRDLKAAQQDKEDSVRTLPPSLQLLNDLLAVWPQQARFVATNELVRYLIGHDLQRWGDASAFGRALTPQRFGRTLARSFDLRSTRQGDGPRGYRLEDINRAARRLGLVPLTQTDGIG